MEQTNLQTGSNNKLVTVIAVLLGVVVMIIMIIQFSKFSKKDDKSNTLKETYGYDSAESETTGNTPDSYTDNTAILTEAANDVNKSCPFMVDKETRLDNAMVLPNNTFQYNYTLVNTVEGSFDHETLKSSIRPVLLNMIRSNPELQIFRNYKTSFAYSYKDMNGVFLFKLMFTPDMYQ